MPDQSNYMLAQFGWPFLSHKGSAAVLRVRDTGRAAEDSYAVHGALSRVIYPGTPAGECTPGLPPSMHGAISFAYTPLWGGLMANTLFYAIAYALITSTARVHRRLRRIRGGLCPICKYDLRYDLSRGCPECGWRKDEIVGGS